MQILCFYLVGQTCTCAGRYCWKATYTKSKPPACVQVVNWTLPKGKKFVFCFLLTVLLIDNWLCSFCFQASLNVLDEPTTSLWFSGKEMLRGKKLMDYVGKNEKTKIIAKLQKVSICGAIKQNESEHIIFLVFYLVLFSIQRATFFRKPH